MNEELRDELFAIVCTKRMAVNTSFGHQHALADALLEVVERRLAAVKKEAYDEGLEEGLATNY